MKNDDDEKLV